MQKFQLALLQYSYSFWLLFCHLAQLCAAFTVFAANEMIGSTIASESTALNDDGKPLSFCTVNNYCNVSERQKSFFYTSNTPKNFGQTLKKIK